MLRLKCYIESFYINTKNKIRILLQFLVKNLKYSFASSIMKNIVAPAARTRFLKKLIC